MEELSEVLVLEINHQSDVSHARRKLKELALSSGFQELEAEELALVISELGTNLLKHAGNGQLIINVDAEALHIESRDKGPGIPDPQNAIKDGFSSKTSLGVGLGVVNRLMDVVDIQSRLEPPSGTIIKCSRYLRTRSVSADQYLFDVGISSACYPGLTVNGDSFVVHRWGRRVLVGVIDGLGHGRPAHQAAQAARNYIARHYDLDLKLIFAGTDRCCLGTRGVVMALARLDWDKKQIQIANVGNVDVRLFQDGASVPGMMVRRGIIGMNAPQPMVTTHPWTSNSILVMFSDGVNSHWGWEQLSQWPERAEVVARQMLVRFNKSSDDATVLVVRSGDVPAPEESVR